MRCPLGANFKSFLFSSEKEEEWKEKRKEGKEKEEGEGFNIGQVGSTFKIFTSFLYNFPLGVCWSRRPFFLISLSCDWKGRCRRERSHPLLPGWGWWVGLSRLPFLWQSVCCKTLFLPVQIIIPQKCHTVISS